MRRAAAELDVDAVTLARRARKLGLLGDEKRGARRGGR
ncbi:MAG: hypothetical protein AB1938_25810 [Myxococcota bacterium]